MPKLKKFYGHSVDLKKVSAIIREGKNVFMIIEGVKVLLKWCNSTHDAIYEADKASRDIAWELEHDS